MGCWRKKNLKEHPAKFSRSKRSSAGGGPSSALPPADLSVLFSIQEAADCVGLFWGFGIGLEQIKDRTETIRLIFSWVQPKIWIQVFGKNQLKYNLHTVLPLSQIKGFALVVVVYILPVFKDWISQVFILLFTMWNGQIMSFKTIWIKFSLNWRSCGLCSCRVLFYEFQIKFVLCLILIYI